MISRTSGNAGREFHCETRGTTRSSRLPIPMPGCFRKSARKKVKLCHLIIEANSAVERETALDMLEENARSSTKVSGAKNNDAADFLTEYRRRGCTRVDRQNNINRRSEIGR